MKTNANSHAYRALEKNTQGLLQHSHWVYGKNHHLSLFRWLGHFFKIFYYERQFGGAGGRCTRQMSPPAGTKRVWHPFHWLMWFNSETVKSCVSFGMFPVSCLSIWFWFFLSNSKSYSLLRYFSMSNIHEQQSLRLKIYWGEKKKHHFNINLYVTL